ncbi:MAG TPA: hypothetical protein VGP82_20935 [Ktedonobacterales bacterium]|jgi:hypothetical protein|nr:hypothetical protein [Ktedonobacterales bacterium]
MDERPDWESDRMEPTGNERSSPEESSLRHDSPTIPGVPWHGSTANGSADFSTQPVQAEFRPSTVQPEWPVARAGGRPNPSTTQRPGYCFGIAIVSMLGAALVLALVAGTLFAVRTIGSAPPTGENGVASSASQTATAPTPTVRPAQPSPTPMPTATPAATSAPAPTPPLLSVSPQQATGSCLLGRYPDLTVKNTGGSDLTWTATTSATAVQVEPASGTLAAGATQTVTLSGVHLGNALTITFSGNGGDATVTITCA